MIVECTLKESYLTLSYVWGEQTEPCKTQSRKDNNLDDAPLTVQDAMRVVRKLGYQYLWVDRFCIDQNDTPARETMIANMDLIYENSIATIVALSGDNDQAGLPGVSVTSRVPQQCVEYSFGKLISTSPPLATAIEQSKWNTRGWTYQEARLSRRCLFFSANQVYFACRDSTWSEAVPFPPNSSSIAALLNSARLDGNIFGRKDISHVISRDRLMYTKRKLTFPGDALNAFRGILRRSQYITFWGVPVMFESSRANVHDSFSLGLLWIKRPSWMKSGHLQAPIMGLTRRHGFPTWSWASLETDIHQDGYGEQSLYGQYLEGNPVEFPYNEARIEFSVKIDGSFDNLTDVLRQPHLVSLPEDSAELLIKGHITSLKRKWRGDHAWYHMGEAWVYFQPDLCTTDSDWPGQPDVNDYEEISDDALILIQWGDSSKTNKTRFVMILNWIDEYHYRAERKGLLTQYRTEFSIGWVNSLPRVYKEFILQ